MVSGKMQRVDWRNPYCGDGEWYRGNLHSHCREYSPCATDSQAEMLAGYEAAGYDFLAFSDHLSSERFTTNNLLLFPGVEWNSRRGSMGAKVVTHQDHFGIYHPSHTLLASVLEPRTSSELFAGLDPELLIVANHPAWEYEHHSLYTLATLTPQLDGLEIYNGSLEVDEGFADVSMSHWDRLLSAGHRLLGFAGDDAHCCREIGRGFLMVQAEAGDQISLFTAIRRGAFYSSTGAKIDYLGREGNELIIEVPEPSQIRVLTNGSSLVAESCARHCRVIFPGKESTRYLRFEVTNANYNKAWSQPFFY